jgi:hypothetical protein
VLQKTAYVLAPIVRLLLQHGITYPQLAETLKSVFIEAALHSAASGSRRITDSQLAVRTGIHRKDIKRLRGTKKDALPTARHDTSHSLTSAVFTRWLTDPGYTDQLGRPRSLPRHGNSTNSFDALVKSISTDVHPRTVLNELQRLGLVIAEADKVQLKESTFVPNADFAQMLEYMGANLHDHAAAAVQNMLGTGPVFLEQSIYSEAVHANAVSELASLARQEWSHVLRSVVPEVARREPAKAEDAPAGQARVRLGMYFYAEHADSTAPSTITTSSDR